MTVGELKEQLAKYPDAKEICVAIDRKDGRGMTGKLKWTEEGSRTQIWLRARVLDPSQE